jgi:hypothetical protein
MTRQNHSTFSIRLYSSHSAKFPDALDFSPFSTAFAADKQILAPECPFCFHRRPFGIWIVNGMADAIAYGRETETMAPNERGSSMFKKIVFTALIGLALSGAYAQAGVRLNIGINIPLFPVAPPPRPVYVAPAPVYVAPAPVPVYVQPNPRPVYLQPSPAAVYAQPVPVPAPR